jgi:hypothetical protein
MALSIVEVVKAQTTSSTTSLQATFSAAPQVGDRIIAFVIFETGLGYRDNSTFAISGLGANWRLMYAQSFYNGQVDWFGVYEAINVDGVGVNVSVTESSTATTSNFAVTCFNVRGVPTGTAASPLYGITNGNSSNPPLLTVTPLSTGDVVMGSWYQYSSATAPTVATVPASGWSSYSTTMTSMSVHWRYKTAADTSNHTMDSPTDAIYTSFGLASQLSSAKLHYVGLEALTAQTNPLRRFNRVGLEVMSSTKHHRYDRVLVEALTSRFPYVKGWGQSI